MSINNSKAAEKAASAESLRLSGNFPEAIIGFSEALKLSEGHKFYWAYAHRGAARAALGNFEGAKRDLQEASDLYKQVHGDDYVWARIYKAETARLESYHHEADALKLLQDAIDDFNVAAKSSSGNPWLLAHRGAAHTRLGFLYLAKGKTSEAKGELDKACTSFDDALKVNRSYAWASAFWGIALLLVGCCESDRSTMKKLLDQARTLLGEAGLAGMDRHEILLNTLMQCCLYMAKHMAKDPAKQTDAQKAYYDATVEYALQLLQIDSDSVTAPWFLAEGMRGSGKYDPKDVAAAAHVAQTTLKSAIERLQLLIDPKSNANPSDMQAWIWGTLLKN